MEVQFSYRKIINQTTLKNSHASQLLEAAYLKDVLTVTSTYRAASVI
jgi:hypothetical protein